MSIEQNVTSAQSDQSISNIDAATSAALAAAQARKNAKKAVAPTADAAAQAEQGKKRTVKTPEQRLQEAAQLEKDRAARKAARAKARDERRAAKPAPEPAHMKKVAKAAERLPSLSKEAQSFFDEAKAALSSSELIAVSAHLQLHCRATATIESSACKLEVGDSVKIVSTDQPAYAKFIGLTGTVFKVGRIRCQVTVPGQEKPVYLHTSDVEPFEAPATESTPAESAAA